MATAFTDAQLLLNVREAIYALTTSHSAVDGTLRPPAKSYMINGRQFTALDLDQLRKWEQALQTKIAAAASSRAAAGVEFRGAV